MTKILWFSRHTMSEEQHAVLIHKFGEIELKQIDHAIASAYELQEDIEWADCIAIAMPINLNLQQQFLKIAGDRPVITTINPHEKTEAGTKILSRLAGWPQVQWYKIVKIDVVSKHFC